MNGLLGVDHLVRGLLSQPQRAGARTQSRNTLGINHPLAESSPVSRIPISMMPGGGPASGYTQEDIATLALPKETTLFSPLGYDITDKDLAKFGLATDALDLVPGAAVLGGLATGAGLLGRAVKGNRVAPESDEMMSAMLGPAMQRQGLLDDAMVTYHGSPHQFDEFSLDKIGTGEGAQKYGHGLYFAENPGVAGTYSEMAGSQRHVNGLLYDNTRPDHVAAHYWNMFEPRGKSRTEIANILREDAAANSLPAHAAAAELVETGADVKGTVEMLPVGNIYEVDIPDEAIAKMLDWDAPLSEQPESVRAAIDSLIDNEFDGRSAAEAIRKYNMRGEQIYDRVLGQIGRNHPSDASDFLNRKGIPGIKYYDGGSRAAGEGTRNIVVFDDKLPKVLKRNGEPVNALAMDEVSRMARAQDI